MACVIYEPNVGGLALADHAYFALLRFRGWERIHRTTPNGDFEDIWPSSFIEVVDRTGRPVASIQVPGRGRSVAANRHGYVAVVTEDLAGPLHVLVGRLPAAAARTIAADQ